MANDAGLPMGNSPYDVERLSAPDEVWGIENGSARVTVGHILAWADAHHAATGLWPTSSPAAVPDAPGHTWDMIDQALRQGHCGWNRKLSLARLLAEHRGLGNPSAVARLTVGEILASRPRLTVERILAWADAYHAAHGLWPCNEYKPGAAAPGETWKAIDQALKVGWRGLTGGTSLGRLLVEHRGPEAGRRHPRLTVAQILAWADAHHAASGQWPVNSPCAVAEAPGVTWEKIELALRRGRCGLTRKTSLARVLAQHRGVRNQRNLLSSMVDQTSQITVGSDGASPSHPDRHST